MSGLEDIPQWFADYFSINLASAQVILSIMLIFMVTLPVLYLTKGKGLLPPIMFFLMMCVCVGIGWLPFWLIIGAMVMGAFAVAVFGSNIIAGD